MQHFLLCNFCYRVFSIVQLFLVFAMWQFLLCGCCCLLLLVYSCFTVCCHPFSCTAFAMSEEWGVLYCVAFPVWHSALYNFVVCCSVVQLLLCAVLCFSLCGGFSRITFAVWCSLLCGFHHAVVVWLLLCDVKWVVRMYQLWQLPGQGGWHQTRLVVVHCLCQFPAVLLVSHPSFACVTDYISQLSTSWKTMTCFSFLSGNSDDSFKPVLSTSSEQVRQ